MERERGYSGSGAAWQRALLPGALGTLAHPEKPSPSVQRHHSCGPWSPWGTCMLGKLLVALAVLAGHIPIRAGLQPLRGEG